MARVVATQAYTMPNFDVSDIDNGTLTKNATDRMVYTFGSEQFAFIGSGLTVDGSNHATGGTVTGFTIYDSGAPELVITGLNIQFTDLNTYIQGHDSEGFKEFLLSGDDRFIDSTGFDYLQGYGGADAFVMTGGGHDAVEGGDGNDIAKFGDTFQASDTFNGGDGNDTLSLSGDYTAGVFVSNLTSVETVRLGVGFSYAFNFDDIIGVGNTLTMDASSLGSADSLSLNLSAVIDGTVVVIGGSGSDTFTAGAGAETFNGGGGDDTFNMGANFSAASNIDGGRNDTDPRFGPGSGDLVELNGDYSAGVTFGATTMRNVETLTLIGGHDYKLTTNDLTVGGGQLLVVDASDLAVTEKLTFDGSAETNGFFSITGGRGNDTITGGARGDFISGGRGDDHLYGGGGDDLINMGGRLTSADVVDGGAGHFDVVYLDGDYSAGLTFGATTMTNVEYMVLFDAHSYNLTTNDAMVAQGQLFGVDASSLSGGQTLTFDGSAETNGFFQIFGGTGADIIIGGAKGDYIDGGEGNNQIYGGGGNDFLVGCDDVDLIVGGRGSDYIIGESMGDTLDGGAGRDLFEYDFASDSTSTDFDTIIGFDTHSDVIVVLSPVTVAAPVVGGTLSLATFDSDLEAAIGAGQMAAGQAVLFTPDAGDQLGKTFLVIDFDGTAGYLGGQDIVIYLQNPGHIADFGDFNFS